MQGAKVAGAVDNISRIQTDFNNFTTKVRVEMNDRPVNATYKDLELKMEQFAYKHQIKTLRTDLQNYCTMERHHSFSDQMAM